MKLCYVKVIKFLQNLLICHDHYLLQHISFSGHLVTMNNRTLTFFHVLLFSLYIITGNCYKVF